MQLLKAARLTTEDLTYTITRHRVGNLVQIPMAGTSAPIQRNVKGYV